VNKDDHKHGGGYWLPSATSTFTISTAQHQRTLASTKLLARV